MMENNGMHITRAVITIFNSVIVLALPVFCLLHIKRVALFRKWSKEWWFQISIVLGYVYAINAEISALWSRLRAYYLIHMVIDETAYVLTTWDRWGHLLFYIWFIVFTWMVSTNSVPKYLQKAIG